MMVTMMGRTTCYLKHTVSTSSTASGKYQWSFAEFVPLLISHTSLPSAVCHLRLYSVVCGYYGADNIPATQQLVQRHCLLCSAKSNVNKNLILLQHIINPLNVTMIWHPRLS